MHKLGTLFIACTILIILTAGCGQSTKQNERETNTHSIIPDTTSVLDLLVEGRVNHELIQPISESYDSFTIDEAYLIQTKLVNRLEKDLGKVIGYKIAYATESAMESNNLSEPVYGPFFEKQQIANHGVVDLSEFITFGIENEIAFTINADITEPIQTMEELASCIKSISLAFDIATARFDNSKKRSIHDFIISGGGAHRFILGEPIENNDIDLVDHILSIQQDEETVYSGSTDEVYGNPWKALFWIINDLLEHNRPVKENMVFLTGKVDNPYKPEMAEAAGKYIGSADNFPNVECMVEN